MNSVVQKHVGKEDVTWCVTKDGLCAQRKQHYSVKVNKEGVCEHHQKHPEDLVTCNLHSDVLHLSNGQRAGSVGHQYSCIKQEFLSAMWLISHVL